MDKLQFKNLCEFHQMARLAKWQGWKCKNLATNAMLNVLVIL